MPKRLLVVWMSFYQLAQVLGSWTSFIFECAHCSRMTVSCSRCSFIQCLSFLKGYCWNCYCSVLHLSVWLFVDHLHLVSSRVADLQLFPQKLWAQSFLECLADRRYYYWNCAFCMGSEGYEEWTQRLNASFFFRQLAWFQRLVFVELAWCIPWSVSCCWRSYLRRKCCDLRYCFWRSRPHQDW